MQCPTRPQPPPLIPLCPPPPAMGHGSSWSCFFAPIASPLCSQEVALALSANQLPPCIAPAEGYRAAAAAAERVVCVNTSSLNDLKFEASAAGLWGEAYAKDPDVVEHRGEVQLEGTEHKKVGGRGIRGGCTPGRCSNLMRFQGYDTHSHSSRLIVFPSFLPGALQLHWWRAQAVRFMLRWPSAHLCHVINQQRHTAYGMHVANRIARQAELHSQLLQSLPPLPPPNDSDAPSAAAAAEARAMAAAVAAAAAARFAGGNFSTDSTAAPAAAAAGAGGGGGASGASLVCEPYMVRPIMSVHVRQSDKQVEMGVWSFAAHMLFAARLQRTLVDLKHVWLSTEMQASQHDKIKALLPMCSLPFPFCPAKPPPCSHSAHLPTPHCTSTRITPCPSPTLPATTLQSVINKAATLTNARVCERSSARPTGNGGGPEGALGHHAYAARCTRLSSPIPLRPPLPTTLQSVINEAAMPLYAGWTFLYAANGRLPEGALDPHAYDTLQSPAASLASLLIAAQCDVFLGSLGSNWSRLINELRATNGRLYNGFVAMNLGEW
ncbi:unnamed protein product [Closterium sp. Naga37s-1]|nr:unnamed protein product [Closterium sp. Naga37s-1]